MAAAHESVGRQPGGILGVVVGVGVGRLTLGVVVGTFLRFQLLSGNSPAGKDASRLRSAGSRSDHVIRPSFSGTGRGGLPW